MSSRAENWAWERDDVKGITKFVLVYLARRAYYDDGAACLLYTSPSPRD